MDIATVVSILLQLIQTVVLPNLNSAGTVAKVITTLEQVIPVILQGATHLVPIVQNIIASLRGSGLVSTEDLDRLDAAEALLDTDFDSAADAAEKQDQ